MSVLDRETTMFDWMGLWRNTLETYYDEPDLDRARKAAADYLRDRVSEAFVPIAGTTKATELYRAEVRAINSAEVEV